MIEKKRNIKEAKREAWIIFDVRIFKFSFNNVKSLRVYVRVEVVVNGPINFKVVITTDLAGLVVEFLPLPFCKTRF